MVGLELVECCCCCCFAVATVVTDWCCRSFASFCRAARYYLVVFTFVLSFYIRAHFVRKIYGNFI